MQNPRPACPIEETSSAALSIEMSDSERAQADAPVIVSLEAKANQTPSTVLEGVVELRRQASAAVVPSVTTGLGSTFAHSLEP